MASRPTPDVEPTQIIFRTLPGWQMCEQSETGDVTEPCDLMPCTDHDFVLSPDGSHIASIIEDTVQIYNTSTRELLFTINHERVRNVYFSPLNTYIFTYHRRLSADGKMGNFVGWQLYEASEPTLRRGVLEPREPINPEHQPAEVMRFIMKDFDSKNPPISFTADERIAVRTIRDGILILHGRNIGGRAILKEAIEGVRSVCCAPTFGKLPLSIAVFTPIKKGRPANVSIYSLNKNRLFRGATRSFFNVDTVQFIWNNRGDCVLVFASSEVDTSGQSYYGHNSLYLFHTEDNLTAQIPVAESGKLQDVAWHPDSREFVMIDDHPMKITCFDWKGAKKHSFGTYARNMLKFSPRGRYLWAGGFGNLNGEMDFWEYKSRTHLGYAEDESCRYFSWSPDGRTFLTARTYPLRTVDNGYRVYKYNGQKICDVPFERLYQIAYRQKILHRPTWEDRSVYGQHERSPSPGAIRNASKNTAKPKAKKAYVPPHMRGRMGDSDSGGRGAAGRGRGGRGGRQKFVVGLGYVDMPDSERTLSERLRENLNAGGGAQASPQKQQSGGGKRKRNRRKKQNQSNQSDEKADAGTSGDGSTESGNQSSRRSSYNRGQQLENDDDDDGTFWPRGQKFGVVNNPEANSGGTESGGKGKKRKRKRKRKSGTGASGGDETGITESPGDATSAPNPSNGRSPAEASVE